MGKFLNSRRWVGDLMLFEALAGGHLTICKYINCQHTGELEQNFSYKSNAGREGGGGGMGGF